MIETKIYDQIEHERAKFWVALIASAILGFMNFSSMFFSLFGVPFFILYSIVFVQSIRGLWQIGQIKRRFMADPLSVKLSEVVDGPLIIGIPGINWFAAMLR